MLKTLISIKFVINSKKANELLVSRNIINDGFTLIEVLLSMALFGIIFSMFFNFISLYEKNISYMNNKFITLSKDSIVKRYIKSSGINAITYLNKTSDLSKYDVACVTSYTTDKYMFDDCTINSEYKINNSFTTSTEVFNIKNYYK